MKGIIVLALILLTGCASYQSLEQLEAQALVSGDWSAVERRERIIVRRKQRNSFQCPPDSIAYCEMGISTDRCTCVDADRMRSFLGGNSQ